MSTFFRTQCSISFYGVFFDAYFGLVAVRLFAVPVQRTRSLWSDMLYVEWDLTLFSQSVSVKITKKQLDLTLFFGRIELTEDSSRIKRNVLTTRSHLLRTFIAMRLLLNVRGYYWCCLIKMTTEDKCSSFVLVITVYSTLTRTSFILLTASSAAVFTTLHYTRICPELAELIPGYSFISVKRA